MIVNGPIPDNFMKDDSKALRSAVFLHYDQPFKVLDQLQLPLKIEYIAVTGSEDAFKVIKSMQVRGAPLIAIVGIRGLLLDLVKVDKIVTSSNEFENITKQKAEYLISSRPTAINLSNALASVVEASKTDGTTLEKFERVRDVVMKIFNDEQEENRRLIWNGYQEVVSTKHDGHKFTVMTVCNTGCLATVSWGTALGVIQALHAAGKINIVYALETRPYNQGIRLTASELSHGEIPFKVITDNMAAWVMKTCGVDAVLVGADQVALNGDTANKIGTYMLAVLSKHHGVPFYPVVPFTSINIKRETGDDIPIEERPAEELLRVNGTWLGQSTTPVLNPAFDVTPGTLITKVITDFGNYAPTDLRNAVFSTDGVVPNP